MRKVICICCCTVYLHLSGGSGGPDYMELACIIAVEQIIFRKDRFWRQAAMRKSVKGFPYSQETGRIPQKDLRKLKGTGFSVSPERTGAFHFDDTPCRTSAQEKKEKSKGKMEQASFLYCCKPSGSRKRREVRKGTRGRGREREVRSEEIRLQKISPSVFLCCRKSGAGYESFDYIYIIAGWSIMEIFR